MTFRTAFADGDSKLLLLLGTPTFVICNVDSYIHDQAPQMRRTRG